MECIQFDNVSFTYPDAEVPALTELSFSLQEGGIYLICGQSGCGKSTLMKHMKKEQIPFGKGTGNMYFYGEDIEQLPTERSCREIGFVGQLPDEQIVTDKVWHELAFGLESLGVSSGEIRQRTGEIAEYFGIQKWFHRNTGDLSGGQKQILNLAAVMVMGPRLLLLDEPTSQLDPIGAERFLHTLKKLNQDFGTTIVLTEHRLEEALPLADQVLLMHEGRLLGMGPVGETARLLHQGEQTIGRRLPVEDAMPASLQLYRKTGCAEKAGTEECPITVREGIGWLENWRQEQGVSEKEVGKKKRTEREPGEKKMALSAKKVSFRYERGNEILSEMNLELPMGSIYALLGGNGAGKTTALKVLAGIKKPTGGKIRREGTCGYLPQNPQLLFTENTVEEELWEGLTFGKKNVDREEALASVKEMLEQMELLQVRESNPFDISGGQAQRLAIGKLLLCQRDILVLDEPTKGMDAAFKGQFASLLQKLTGMGKTILLVSHDVEFCARYAEYCGLLFDGQIISESPAKQFFRQNTFYTTQARKIARRWYPDCVTVEDILDAMQVCLE